MGLFDTAKYGAKLAYAMSTDKFKNSGILTPEQTWSRGKHYERCGIYNLAEDYYQYAATKYEKNSEFGAAESMYREALQAGEMNLKECPHHKSMNDWYKRKIKEMSERNRSRL
jgi:hypothetical protein